MATATTIPVAQTPPPEIVNLALTEHEARVIRTLLFSCVSGTNVVTNLARELSNAGIYPYEDRSNKVTRVNATGCPLLRFSDF